ncbi:MAG: Hsp70 family protein [Saccharothrix sp.]|nr:Hsp70 family protein [Saccharothrix sp.]
MTRETIDFGIDLGTTNSVIAVAGGHDANVLRNNQRHEYTPSAVWVGGDRIYVGARARKRIEADPDSVATEFKLQMGARDWRRRFGSGREMSAAELSAEVLKSLRADTGEAIESAVITVPAAFELDQCDATREAAALAGLSFAPLLQEPTAAAWAYSAGAGDGKAYWLVYDLGGGTFDAALLSVRDGEFVVVNHAGDNFLGGKLIDWGLVEDILIPAVREQHGLVLARDDPNWRGAVAKLKQAAEDAKIELSRQDAAEVLVEIDDRKGRRIDFEHTLTRADLERVAVPLYARSIALCRKALAEKNLGPGDIERVLLVGGSTLSPMLRELLDDPDEGLGIRVDHSLDPVTVVAKGAAIFAGTQRLPRRTGQVAVPGQVVLELEHEVAGPETEPLVGGRAKGEPGHDWTGCTIEFVNHDSEPAWRSGLIALSPDGTFATRLLAYERTSNTYEVELRDPRGTRLPTDRTTVPYRHTPLRGGNPVLSHSIGVGLEDNTVAWIVTKGTELPARERVVLRTAVEVRRHDRTGLIRVPIIEGERPRADRNTLIGRLDVRPEQVRRDVPLDSEVEINVRVDESFAMTAEAYVPVLDEEFLIDVELGRAEKDVDRLREAAREVENRYHELRGQAAETTATEALERLGRFDGDKTVEEVHALVSRVAVDPDAAQTCQARLRDAQTRLDEIDELLRLPQLVQEANALRQHVGRMVSDSGDPLARQQLREAEAALDRAIEARDFTVIQRQVEVVRGIAVRLLHASGQLDAVMFGIYEDELADHADPRVQRLLNEGRNAANHGDRFRLAEINAQLRQFTSVDPTPSLHDFSTVQRGSRQ